MVERRAYGARGLVYLLDTNACIDFLERRSVPLVERIDKAFGKLGVSVISAAELLVGTKTSSNPVRDRRTIDAFLTNLDVYDFDMATARVYGDTVRGIGVKRKSFDRLIGVQAITLELILVTRNSKNFADVPGLKVENWTV